MRPLLEPIPLSVAVRDRRLLGGTFSAWWPRQLGLLDSLDGPERRHFWCIGRQSGKDAMIAALAVWDAALRPDLDLVLPAGMWRTTLVCCPRQDQAQDFIGTCSTHIANSPVLQQVASVKSDRIEFALPRVDARGRPFTARVRILSLPANAHTTRGHRSSLVIFNEMAHLDDTAGPGSDQQLWTALTPSLRKFGEHGRIVCISTPAGTRGKFYELCESAQGGLLEGSSRFEQFATWEVDPEVTEAQVEQWRADLGEALFEQEYGARFVDAGGSFFDLSEIEFDDAPTSPEDGEGWIAGFDPAFHQDCFGVALIGRSRFEREQLVVGAVASIPPQGVARSFDQRRAREDATLAKVWELIEPYGPVKIFSDQHNSAAIESFFGRRGVPVEIVRLSRPLQTAAFVGLRARLVDGSLRCWRHPRLVDELYRVRAKDTETVYLPRFGDSHCDAAAALALGASKVGESAPAAMAVLRSSGIGGRHPVPSQVRYSTSEFG